MAEFCDLNRLAWTQNLLLVTDLSGLIYSGETNNIWYVTLVIWHL